MVRDWPVKNTIPTDAGALDRQAAQAHRVSRPGTDQNAGATRGNKDAGDASVIYDANRLVDGQRPIAGRVEHIDLAAGAGRL